MKNIEDGDALEVALDLAQLTPYGRGAKLAGKAVALAPTPSQAKAAVKIATPAAKAAGRRLSKALAKVNSQARTKGGKLRKGWTQSKIMKKAHKLARGMK